jgi:hypothetical protein
LSNCWGRDRRRNYNEITYTFSTTDFGGYRSELKRVKYPDAGTKTHLVAEALLQLI